MSDMRQFSTSKFMITLNYVLYMVFVFVFYIIELVNMGDLLLIRRYGNKWKKNGEWKEGVQMRRVVIKVNVGYLGDQNVFWRSHPSFLHVLWHWRAPQSPLHNMVRYLAAVRPSALIPTRQLPAPPYLSVTPLYSTFLLDITVNTLFFRSNANFNTPSVIFKSRWYSINFVTVKLYYLSTCDYFMEKLF
jgi:hypothetical protein